MSDEGVVIVVIAVFLNSLGIGSLLGLGVDQSRWQNTRY
ncbi:hypothetical protein KS4_23190 [Poriferisphaera corsica]|uniref:Uncharacterized protein n=1 Tax=Poriferisphaera corsica TaxID=2528020 RepID=A0A517YVJ6_9BACT|nr:hypothetical protein KS4_23190 [Poriferisphaera corsica]